MGKSMEALEKMILILNQSTRARELMEVWPKSIRMEFTDEPAPFYMIVENGQMRIEPEIPKEPEILMVGEGEEFAKVIAGQKDVSHSLFRGQIKINKGTVKDIMALSRILGSVRKEVQL